MSRGLPSPEVSEFSGAIFLFYFILLFYHQLRKLVSTYF